MTNRYVYLLCISRTLLRFLSFILFSFSFSSLAYSLPQVSDPALQKCIDQLAQKHQWQAVEDVTSIKCHKKGVKTVAGLQQFSALQSLSLFSNSLSEFDSSYYPKLVSLNLARNRIENLSVSNLPALEKLYLFDNKIKHLALENLPKLSILKANSNTMQTLSYESLTALQKIYIFDNTLETIDIHNLPAMEYMDCRENPMPDELYDEMDKIKHATILHDGNAEDW